MKCRNCEADLSDDDKFCCDCGTTVSKSTKFVLCKGQIDGKPCGAELKESYRFCKQCGKKVDKSLFQKKQIQCEGKKEDGSVCGNLLEEDDKFCKECGTRQIIAAVSSEKGGVQVSGSSGKLGGENVQVFSTEKTLVQLFSSSSTAVPSGNVSVPNMNVLQDEDARKEGYLRHPAEGQESNLHNMGVDDTLSPEDVQVFGSGAKLDGENAQAFNTEKTLPLFSYICTAVPSENVLVSNMNVSQNGDANKGENVGQSHFSGYSFPQISSVAGAFGMESQLDVENTGQSPSFDSSNSAIINDNNLDNDHEEGKLNFVSFVESSSRSSAEWESQLSNVNLSGEKGDDLEDLSEDSTDDENESYEGADKYSENSNTDNYDTKFAEDKATELKLSHEQTTKRSKRKKKQPKYKQKMKKMMMDREKNMPSAESSEQQQEQQQETVMESDRNRNVKHPAEDQESNSYNMMVDDTSPVAVGSIVLPMDSTNQMEIDEGKKTIQIDQSSESDSAMAVDEQYKENTSKDQIEDENTKHDKVPVQERGTEQDAQMNKVAVNAREPISYAKFEQGASMSLHDAKKDVEKLNRMGDVESLETKISKESIGTQYNEDNDSGKFQACSVAEDTKTNDTKIEKSQDKVGQTNEVSKADKLSKDGKIQKTSKASKTGLSQNASSKDAASGEKNNEKDTNARKNTDEIRVHFHSLVSAEFGMSSTDVLVVRFGDDDLGGWKSDKHRPKVVRKHGDDYTEFKLTLDVPRRLLFKSNTIQYKYGVAVVDKGTKFMWEHYGLYPMANRSLNLPNNKKNIDEWHQYDGIVFPRQKEGFFNNVKSYFKGDVKERVRKDLVQSIGYFLPQFFQDLSKGKLPEMSLEEALTQLEELLHSLRKVYFVDFDSYSNSADYQGKISETILQPMLISFEKVPLCNWEENQDESEKRMLLAISILSALNQLKMELNTAEENLLARGLLVRPSHETKTCHDLACIEKYFPKGKKQQLNAYLISFINRMANNATSPMIFFCMPLHHFLSGALKPFDRVPEDCSHDANVPKWWGIEFLSDAADNFQKGQHYQWTMKLDQLISILHPLFEMDYLLPRTLMAMLKLEMVGDAIKTEKIPYEVCAATLTFYVRTTRPRPLGLYPSYEEQN